MENYISINGKKIKLSDETVKEFKKQLGKKPPKLPKSWEELGQIDGSYINEYGGVESYTEDYPCLKENKNIWPTKELAEASLAMSQLAQLRDRYNDGWEPDWTSSKDVKYVIFFIQGEQERNVLYNIQCFLAFKTVELRDMFSENFHDLIEKAKPLL